jgi:hypothetical protein
VRPAAVAALIRRTSKYGETEPDSLAYREAHFQALEYFTSEDAKKQMLERFANAGYAPDAVEVEAFERALAQFTNLISSRPSRDDSCWPYSRRLIDAIQGARRSCARSPTT